MYGGLQEAAMGSQNRCRMLFLTLFFAGIFLSGSLAMAIEEARYKVLEKSRNFELRQYEPHVVAETMVEGDFSEVGNEGFRRLFGYISGKNHSKRSISMTAPVSQEGESEKIPMTAPVNQEVEGNKWRITFLMPSGYALETLPAPIDPRVSLRQVPGRLMAAIKYSGTWSRERYEAKKALLVKAIGKRGLKQLGEPIFARYNSPFTPWILRRNEVLIQVEMPK